MGFDNAAETRIIERKRKRNQSIAKQEILRGTWELRRVCRDFLQEWEGDWTEEMEKTRMRKEDMKKKEDFERKERFKKIDKKKEQLR